MINVGAANILVVSLICIGALVVPLALFAGVYFVMKRVNRQDE